MGYVYSRGRAKHTASDPFRHWHKQYSPCPEHETVPDLVAGIIDGAFDGERLDIRRARETPKDLAGRILNDIVTECEPCRSRTRDALVAYAVSLPRKKIVNC